MTPIKNLLSDEQTDDLLHTTMSMRHSMEFMFNQMEYGDTFMSSSFSDAKDRFVACIEDFSGLIDKIMPIVEIQITEEGTE